MVWGALAAIGLGQVFGMLWYSPLLAGKIWMRVTFPGQTQKQIGDTANSVALPLTLCIQAFLVAILHYFVGPYLGVTSVPAALKVGLALSVVESLVDLIHMLFNRRSFTTYVIDHLFNAFLITETCLCLVFFS